MGWEEKHIEDAARLILLCCAKNFRGDEKVKNFISDLICPVENGGTVKNHSGLANPVSRGGRKRKKRGEPADPKEEEVVSIGIEDMDWMKDSKFEIDAHLDPSYLKHLTKHANK